MRTRSRRHRPRLGRRAAALFLGATLAGAACDDPTGPVGPRNELIAFSTAPEGVSALVAREIFVMRPDGSGLVQLTDGMLATQPVWSPDGSMIAFIRLAAGDRNLYVMDADGSDVRALTTGLGAPGRATWSPDGERVAFALGSALYTVDVDGGDPTRIHDCGDPGCGVPVWSPDGARIAFVAWPASYPMVYLLDVAGGGVTALGTGLEHEQNPDWSPDGTTLLFFGRADGGDLGLVLASPDGEILATHAEDRLRTRSQASFSRDGASIVYYERDFYGKGEEGIYVMGADGGDPRLIREFGPDLDHWIFPDWRP